MLFKNKQAATEEEKFPLLMLEPWRAEEMLEEETVVQQHRLFKAISWLRITIALFTGIAISIYSKTDYILLAILAFYILLIWGLTLRSNTHKLSTRNYAFFIGIFDVIIIGYLRIIMPSSFELVFLFFSIMLSSMILPFFRLLFLLGLAILVLILDWTLSDAVLRILQAESMPFSLKIRLYIESFNAIDNKSPVQLSILITGLSVLALLIHRLAHWSFKNEVKAQFRFKQLRQVLTFNRSVIEHLKSGVLVLTKDGKVISINQRALELLNLHSGHAVTTLRDLSAELSQRFSRWQHLQMLTPTPYKHNRDAEELSVTFSAFGAGQGVVMLTLESVNESFRQAQEAKLTSLGRLTAGVAHEIRNPLSSINSAAELLNEVAINDQQKRLSEMILGNVKRTNQIISDILGLFKDTKSKPELIDVNDTLKQFCHSFAISNKDVSFEIYINPYPGKIYILFDKGQLEQVLWNLAQNALKYGRRLDTKLEIALSCELSDNKQSAIVSVTDNGNGIPDDIQEKIFEPFFTGGQEGSGLGLYLVRELCAANNANIIYDGSDKGAKFRIIGQAFFSNRKRIKPKVRT